MGFSNDDFLNATWYYVDNRCGDNCNDCGLVRQVPDDAYTNDRDAYCNECGFERQLYILGDLDGDESITIADAVYLLYHTLFPERDPL